MGTKFSVCYNRFLDRITEDMYLELTPEDTLRDLRGLLINALPDFEYPRINLLDYSVEEAVIPNDEVAADDFVISSDETSSKVDRSAFAATLSQEEINIVSIIMMIGWVQRQVTSIENIRMKYSGTDFKFTSQANHLAKLQSLLNECQTQSLHFQRLYKRREINSEGKYQSTWYWFGDHNATGN